MTILGMGENLRFEQNFWVHTKFFGSDSILGPDENIWFGRKFYVWVKILGLGENLGLG